MELGHLLHLHDAYFLYQRWILLARLWEGPAFPLESGLFSVYWVCAHGWCIITALPQ